MSIRIALVILLCLSRLTYTTAQSNVRYLTLEDVIRIAQDQSPDALEARQTFRSSYWEFHNFEASTLPSLIFNSTLPEYNQVVNSQMTDGKQSYHNYHDISGYANLSLRQFIGPTGGTLSVNSSLQGTYNFTDTTRAYLTNPINVVLEQPLFSFNQYRWDRKIKPLKYSIARRKYLEQLEDISLQATYRFFNLLLAQVEKKIADINMSNYDTMFRIGKGRYELGKIAENDLLQLELSFLKAQLQVENSNLALDNAQFRFKSYLRIQDSTRIILLPPEKVKFFKIDPRLAIELAFNQSSTPLEQKRQLLEGAAEVNQAKLHGRFDANLYAKIGVNKTSETVQDAYYKPGTARQFSLGMTIPIYDWGVARGSIKVAEAKLEITRNKVQQDSIDFRQNVYLKAIEFNMQQNQLFIAAKSDTVAKKSFEVTKGRYLIGKLNSIIDLNNAQSETDQSRKNYYSSLETYWRSYYEIRKLTLFDFIRDSSIEFDLTNFK